MRGTIAVLPGDGIGPEITRSAVRVLEAVNARFNHAFETKEGVTGGVAYDTFGVHLPEETIETCKKADAILFGAVERRRKKRHSRFAEEIQLVRKSAAS